MTFTRGVTIWCDTDPDSPTQSCGEWIQEEEDLRTTRRQAKKAGWTFAGGRDYCRAHSREMRES